MSKIVLDLNVYKEHSKHLEKCLHYFVGNNSKLSIKKDKKIISNKYAIEIEGDESEIMTIMPYILTVINRLRISKFTKCINYITKRNYV